MVLRLCALWCLIEVSCGGLLSADTTMTHHSLAQSAAAFNLIALRVGSLLHIMNAYPRGNSAARAQLLEQLCHRIAQFEFLIAHLQVRLRNLDDELSTQALRQFLYCLFKDYRVLLRTTREALEHEWSVAFNTENYAAQDPDFSGADKAYAAVSIFFSNTIIDRLVGSVAVRGFGVGGEDYAVPSVSCQTQLRPYSWVQEKQAQADFCQRMDAFIACHTSFVRDVRAAFQGTISVEPRSMSVLRYSLRHSSGKV